MYYAPQSQKICPVLGFFFSIQFAVPAPVHPCPGPSQEPACLLRHAGVAVGDGDGLAQVSGLFTQES